MAFPTGFYIIQGWVSRSELLTTGYKITDLAIQPDMHQSRRWIKPGNEADLIKPAALVGDITGHRKAYGGYVFKWPLMNLSPKMVNYWKEEIFQGLWSNNFTVQTFNRATGEWETYWVVGRFPDYAAEAELQGGGYSNFQITFVNGQVAPEGHDMAINAEGEVDTDVTFTIDSSNVGDSETLDVLLLTYELPEGYEFVSVSGDDWVFEWLDESGDYYDLDTDPPDNPEDVKGLRGTYGDLIAATASVPTVTIVVTPPGAGTTEHTFTLSTVGDFNTENNSETLMVIIPEEEEEEEE